MDRRSFFGAAATLLAVPLAPRRVYSFLWDNPLVLTPDMTAHARDAMESLQIDYAHLEMKIYRALRVPVQYLLRDMGTSRADEVKLQDIRDQFRRDFPGVQQLVDAVRKNGERSGA